MSGCGISDQGHTGREVRTAAVVGWGLGRKGQESRQWPQAVSDSRTEAYLWHP